MTGMTDLQVAAPEHMSPDVLAQKSPAVSKQFGSSAVNPAVHPQLKQTLNLQDPMKAAADGPKKQPPIQTNDGGLTYRADVVGEGVKHNTGGGIFAECLGVACDAVSNNIAPVGKALENQPQAPEIATQKPEIPENTHYTQKATLDMNLTPSAPC